ncbi:MAG: YcgN family cysteine cluster protein [Gammaproteobacteria bacterium]|nr:MAG: YcgN family cysteine cluster protein [Gammaproteobacteria bacterium]
MSSNFWQVKSLAEMSQQEWESLCDGCGRCCLNKLEDEDTGEIYFTNVTCKLLNIEQCCCTDYENRKVSMPDCMILSVNNETALEVMPSTCAYRLLQLGKPLPEWHPLVTGRKESVAEAGITITGKAVSEENIHYEQLPEHLINWVTTK